MRNFILFFILTIFSMHLFSQINNEYLNIDDSAPVINGIDQFGKEINSAEILTKKKIVLVFYRGNWCPYCRKHLASLQENLEALSKKDVSVLVVTPEKVEKILETTEKLDATFSIIHDIENEIMIAYKVAFEVNKKNVANFFGFTKRKIAEYNANDSTVLPVPATYIIEKNGKISYVHYNPDYHKRSDFEKILENL